MGAINDDALAQAVDPSLHPFLVSADPIVVSEARPEVEALLELRRVMSKNTELQGQMKELRDGGSSPAEITNHLCESAEETDPAHREAMQYLVDEYLQLGEGVYIVSPDSGEVVAIVDEKALELYQPGPVLRENGRTAMPLRKMRPEVWSALVCLTHEKGREARILKKLQERGGKAMTVESLLVASRRGRAKIAHRVSARPPISLLSSLGGQSRDFLSHLDLLTVDPQSGMEPEVIDLVGRAKTGVQDPLTLNLKFDRERMLTRVLPQGWVRDLAARISSIVHRKNAARAIDVEDLQLSDLEERPYWVVPPHYISPFSELGVTVFPAEGALPIGFADEKVGVIVVPPEAAMHNVERFDRWELAASLSVRVYVDWAKILPISVTGVYQREISPVVSPRK